MICLQHRISQYSMELQVTWLVKLLYGNYCAFLAQSCTHNVLCRGWLRKHSNLMKQKEKTKTERSLLLSLFIEMPIKPIPCDISTLSLLMKKPKLLCMSTSGSLIMTKRSDTYDFSNCASFSFISEADGGNFAYSQVLYLLFLAASHVFKYLTISSF